MGVSERKLRQRLDRENLILDTSLRMLVEGGYPGFTIDHVAEEIEYSKGTVYQHFSCKEDILAGLLCRTTEYEIRAMEYAMGLSDIPRTQIFAMAICNSYFASRYPGHDMQRMLFSDVHIWNRGNEDRRRKINQIVMREIELAHSVVENAFARGDLNASHVTSGEAFHGVVTIAMGNDEMKRVFSCFREDTVLTPLMDKFFDNQKGGRLCRVLQAYMNGIGWNPVCQGNEVDPALLRSIPHALEKIIPFPSWSRAPLIEMVETVDMEL